MITERTPVDLGASLVAPLCGDHPALSVVGGSVAGTNLGRRVISPVVGDDRTRGVSDVRTQPTVATRNFQHDVTVSGISTKVQDPARGVPV